MVRRRLISSPESWRFLCETAVKFHSGPSGSSVETKVGSPPIVWRTSFLFRSASQPGVADVPDFWHSSVRAIIAALPYFDKIVVIDSFMQHAAAALGQSNPDLAKGLLDMTVPKHKTEMQKAFEEKNEKEEAGEKAEPKGDK